MSNAAIIDHHHATLRRLLSTMLVYIGLADDTGQAMRFLTKTADAYDCNSGIVGDTAMLRAFRLLCDPGTISSRVHTLVRHLLLPVEAAPRRLIIADLPTPKMCVMCKGPQTKSARAWTGAFSGPEVEALASRYSR